MSNSRSESQTVIVSTLAGSGPTGIYSGSFADGERGAARFNCPHGITIDTAGNLYVTDYFNNRIRKVTPQGEVSTFAGGDSTNSDGDFADGQGSNARFAHPVGITIDTAGNLYVADAGNNRIRKVTPEGEVSTLAGSDEMGFADGTGAAARFKCPYGIAIDAAGNLYVADTYNNRIRKVTMQGEVSTLAGSDSPIGKLDFADGEGSVARFYNPRDIAVDAAGNLYVADEGNSRIRKITPDGWVSTLAGEGDGFDGSFADGQGSAARFNGPYGIAIDAAGNLYVADEENQCVRKVTQKGEVSTLAGSRKAGFSDGEGNTACFLYPVGIAIDTAGNLYVADEGNHRIRKIVIERP